MREEADAVALCKYTKHTRNERKECSGFLCWNTLSGWLCQFTWQRTCQKKLCAFTPDDQGCDSCSACQARGGGASGRGCTTCVPAFLRHLFADSGRKGAQKQVDGGSGAIALRPQAEASFRLSHAPGERPLCPFVVVILTPHTDHISGISCDVLPKLSGARSGM